MKVKSIFIQMQFECFQEVYNLNGIQILHFFFSPFACLFLKNSTEVSLIHGYICFELGRVISVRPDSG